MFTKNQKKQEQEEKEEVNSIPQTESKLDCLTTIVNSHLKMDSDDNEIGISCENEDCQKCLLWMYLSSVKHKNASENKEEKIINEEQDN